MSHTLFRSVPFVTKSKKTFLALKLNKLDVAVQTVGVDSDTIHLWQ